MVADDVVYVGSRQAELLALDRQNGTLMWSFQGDEDESLGGIYGSPAVSDELVFVGAYGEELGKLYAVNANNGQVAWQAPFKTGGHIVGSPTVVGNTVLIGSSDGNLYAVDATLGTEKWKFPTGNKIWSAPVVYEDIVYFGSLDHNVYAVTLDEGREIWRFATKGAVASTPLVMDGRVYIGSFGRHFYALEASTGAEVWPAPFTADNWFWTRAVSDGDTIYVGSLDGNLYAIDVDTGQPVWQTPFDTKAPIVSAPALVPEGVVVANDNGDLFLVRAQDGQEIRSFSAKDPVRAPLTGSPSDSIIYFSVMDHSVRAADLERGFWTELWCYNTKDEARCG